MKKLPVKVLSTAAAIALLTPVAPYYASNVQAEETVQDGYYLGGKVGKFISRADLESLTSSQFFSLLNEAGGTGNIKYVQNGKIASLAEIEDAGSLNDALKTFKPGDLTGTYVDYKTGKEVVIPGASLAVESVNAINLTKVTVKFNRAVDAVTAENFSIPGLTVASASLAEDKQTVTLSISGAEVGKTYELTAKSIKVNAQVQPELKKTFTTPSQNELFNPTIEFKDAVLKADGASSTLVTFKLLDAEGNLLKDAQNVEVAFSSTFGNFGEKRVAVQNGIATALLTSEALTSDRTAEVTAQVVEAQDKNLIGVKAVNTILMTPNPGNVDVTTGAMMTEAEAYQADRVIAYFNKEVSVADFVNAQTGLIDPDKAAITVTTDVTNELTAGKQVDVLGLMPVAGNNKALQIILDTKGQNFPLVDNANVKVDFIDKRGTVAVPSTKVFKLTDARKPAMLNVTREGLKTIKVEFSEPVNKTALVKTNWTIDGKQLDNTIFGDPAGGAAAEIKVGDFDPKTGADTRHVVTITLGKDKDGNQIYFKPGTHSIQGANIGDWAQVTDPLANLMNTQTLDFEIPVDNAAPTAVVEVQSPEQFVLTFDKDLNQNAQALQSVLKLQKYNTTTAAWEDVADQTIDVTNISVDGTNKFLVEVKEDWTVVYKTESTNKNYYNDSFRLHIDKDKVSSASNGVKNAEINLPLGGAMTTPDVTSPTINQIVETVGAAAGTSYDVTMSEPVKIGEAANTEGLTPSQSQQKGSGVPTPTAEFIKKDKSVTIPATIETSFVDKEEKVLRVKPTKELEAGDWTLVVRSISDDVGNTAASATKDFTVAKAPEVNTDFKVIWAVADYDNVLDNNADTDDQNNDYVFVKFNKPVSLTGDYKNVLKTSNYTLNGAALPQGSQIIADIINYDDKDQMVDSITIKLPQGSISKPDTTVLNISGYLESAAGEIISNPGEKKLPYNYGEAAVKEVKTVADLKAALANDAYRTVKLNEDIDLNGETLAVNRLVNIDLGGKTIKGDVSVKTSEGGKMTVSNGTLDGNLTVNTPNADFTNAATVTGTTTIKDVASSTFINEGELNAVVIEDANGTSFDNKGKIKGLVTVDTTGAVTLGGKIDNVKVSKAAKLTVAGGAEIKTLTVTAKDVVLDAPADTVTDINTIGEGTVKAPEGKELPVTPIKFTTGTLSISNTTVTQGGTVEVTLTDADLNKDSAKLEKVTVKVGNDDLELTETGEDTGIFKGTTKALETVGEIEVTYTDATNAEGKQEIVKTTITVTTPQQN